MKSGCFHLVRHDRGESWLLQLVVVGVGVHVVTQVQQGEVLVHVQLEGHSWEGWKYDEGRVGELK